MKKLKSINFKALFVDHGEKIGLALIVMVVLLALGSTSWSRFPGTPEELARKAKDARDRFTSPQSNPWPKEKIESFKVVDFNDRASQLFAKLDLPKYEFLTPLTQPLYRQKELSREPEYSPVEFVIAHAGQAILAMSPAGTGSPDGGDPAVPAAGGTPEEPATGFRPSGRAGAGAGGLVAPGAMVPPGAAGGTAIRPPTAMAGGAHAGAPAGAHAGAIAGEAMYGGGGSASNVVARGVRYIAVRGVFPLEQQLKRYQNALKVSSAEASAMFELLDFVLERQAAVAGSEPWKDAKWEEVNVESALDVLRESSDFELDPVSTGVTDGVITMSLPRRLLEYWGEHATHPNVRDFQLKPEDMERELKLQEKVMEEYEKQQRSSEPKIKRKGLSTGQVDVRRASQEMMSGPPGAMAGPSSAHDMPSMMSGFMNEGSVGGGGGGGGPKLTPADIKRRLTADGRLLLFRYFDFDVQPGYAYRYRVKLKIRNPNFERAAADLVDPTLALGTERDTDWSNISNPAVVSASVNYFLKDVERDPSRDDRVRANKAVAHIAMFEWDAKLGTMLHDTLKILSVGQFISEKKKSIVIDAAVPSYKKDVEVPFVTGDVLLDASADFDILPAEHPDLGLRPAQGRSNARLGLLPEALVMTGLGEMKELDPVSERAKEKTLKKRVDDERNEFKYLESAGTQAGGAEGSAYDEMMKPPGAAMMPPAAGKKSPKKKGAEAGAGGAQAPPDAGGKPKSKRSMPTPP